MKRIGVLAPPGARGGGLAILRDLTAMTHDYVRELYDDAEPIRALQTVLLGVDGDAVQMADGTRLAPEERLGARPLDGLYICDFAEPAGDWTEWLSGHAELRAGVAAAGEATPWVAAAGRGVVLALEAGLGARGPVAATPQMARRVRGARRIAIEPAMPVVEAPGLMSAAGLGAEPQLALRLIERVVTPNLASVLSLRAGIVPAGVVHEPDAFAVPVMKPDDLVERACRSLKARFSHPVDMTALAAELGVTPRTLARRFSASLGMGPKAYQQHLRLASAQSMLARTTRPIARIAALVGYADTPFFVELFQRRVGTSPAEFRRRARGSSHA
jgi:transcriptional regulator GlxA family with amidase domain